VRRIVLALDGSNQDETARRLASRIASRAGAAVLPLCAWETEDGGREEYLATQIEALGRMGAAVERVGTADDTRPPYEQILDACGHSSCDLLIVPAPFRDDFARLGRESVGTNLDVLLCRATVPLLVVREPKEEPERCLANVLLPLTRHLAANAEAAAWALQLAERGGGVRILAVSEGEIPESGGLSPAATAEGEGGITSPETAGLIGALQRRTAEIGLGCRVDARRGEEVKTIVEEEAGEELIVILPCCPRDPTGPTFQRIQAIIRLSRNPVLMV
jgi:hypothetical protein